MIYRCYANVFLLHHDFLFTTFRGINEIADYGFEANVLCKPSMYNHLSILFSIHSLFH